MKLGRVLAALGLFLPPLCFAMMGAVAPKIDLIIIGLLNLGFFFAGAITLIGVLSIVSGILFLLGGNQQLAILLLA